LTPRRPFYQTGNPGIVDDSKSFINLGNNTIIKEKEREKDTYKNTNSWAKTLVIEEKINRLEKEISELKISFDKLLDKVSAIVDVKNSLNTESVNYILEECKKMIKAAPFSKQDKHHNHDKNLNNKVNLNNLLFDNKSVNIDDSYAKNADIPQYIEDKEDNQIVFNERSKFLIKIKKLLNIFKINLTI